MLSYMNFSAEFNFGDFCNYDNVSQARTLREYGLYFNSIHILSRMPSPRTYAIIASYFPLRGGCLRRLIIFFRNILLGDFQLKKNHANK